ncbi:MAG: hypothetical protein IH892_21915 [Planctomycetes bacterium]|nr:hypothetical protein [Planctomycetota bacterium]
MATSDLFRLILVSVVLPALAAGLIWGCGRWFTGRGSPSFCWNSAWPNACAIASSYWVVYLGLEGFPPFPPNESRARLFYWVAVAAVLAWGLSLKKIPAVAAWPLKTLLTGAALYFVLPAAVKVEWTVLETVGWLLSLTVVTLGFWYALACVSRTLRKSSDPWVFLGVLLFSVGALVISLGASGSVKLAQSGAALGSALAVYGIFHYYGKAIALHVGGLAPFTLIYVGLLLLGVFISYLPRLSAILLLLCPMAVCLCHLPFCRNRPLALRLAFLTLILMLCGGVAVWLALPSVEPVEYYY